MTTAKFIKVTGKTIKVPAQATKNYDNLTQEKVTAMFPGALEPATVFKRMKKRTQFYIPFERKGHIISKSRVKLLGFTLGKAPKFYVEVTGKNNLVEKGTILVISKDTYDESNYFTHKPYADNVSVIKPIKRKPKAVAKAVEPKAKDKKPAKKFKEPKIKLTAIQRQELQIEKVREMLEREEEKLVKMKDAEEKRRQTRIDKILAKQGYIFVVQSPDHGDCRVRRCKTEYFDTLKKAMKHTPFGAEILYRPAKGRVKKVAKYVTSTKHKGFDWKFISKKAEQEYSAL